MRFLSLLIWLAREVQTNSGIIDSIPTCVVPLLFYHWMNDVKNTFAQVFPVEKEKG